MKSVGIGVVGCGIMGGSHMQAARQSAVCTLVAVADIDVSKAQERAKEYEVPNFYDNIDVLLENPDVDAVVLAMPTCYRTELAAKAFAKGKHVLTEKPVAMNRNEVESMVQVRGNLVAACCSSRYRFTDSAQAAARFIESGKLGNLRTLYCRNMQPVREKPEKIPPEWRLKRSLNGGGIFVNWGCYDLDYLLGLTGWTLEPATVTAQMWQVAPHLSSHVAPGSDAESHIIVLIRCNSGCVISYERGEYVAVQQENAWHIIGSRGSLRLHMLTAVQKKIVFECADSEEGLQTETIWEGEDTATVVHEAPIHDFATAICNSSPPKTTLEQSLVIQKITDAAYESAETGKSVDI